MDFRLLKLLDDDLKARIDDAQYLCEKYIKPRYIGFFDDCTSKAVFEYLKQIGSNSIMFGGYENAERNMAGIFPNNTQIDINSFPIKAITFTYRMEDKLSHRDFLGCIMSLGIRRDKIGDILASDGKCVIFADEDIAEYIKSQIDKVGKTGVKAHSGIIGEIPCGRGYKEISGVISYPRIDSVTAALTNLSREKAKCLIQAQAVSINHIACEKLSDIIYENDIISIKGFGRYIIDSVTNTTKKGKIRLIARKYL